MAPVGRISTPCLMRTTLLSPFVLEPSFLNVKTITWACALSNVHNDMFNRPDGKNYPGASCSFIHEFYLNIMAFKLTLNNKMHGSEYNTKILEDSLKADYNFDLPKSARILPPR